MSFYATLYGLKTVETEAQQRLLSCYTVQIPEDLTAGLRRPISRKEITASIRRAATGKSPGIDGIPFELFKMLIRPQSGLTKTARAAFKPEVTPVVLALETLYRGIQSSNSCPERWTDGVLTLLYKDKGERSNLKNYRPLSIMNIDYKIFTEILMQRLVKALNWVIGTHQYAFLPGRLIDDNIRTIQAILAMYTPRTGKREALRKGGAAILFLDQEKAYDRVDHAFLWLALERLGIPQEFINWLRTLYNDASVRIFINGHLSDPVRVQCGVRQGDPISCPLFNVVIESLALLIQKDDRITGIATDQGPIKVTMFADDTAVVLKNQTEADALLENLDLYCRATGAKVNREKSFLLRFGKTPPTITIDGVVDVSTDHPYEHLGIPIGTIETGIVKQEEIFWNNMKAKFLKITTQWLNYHLSLKGRVLAANSLLISLPRYAARFLSAPSNKAAMEKAYFRLIWSDRSHQDIRDFHACLPLTEGGIGCFDLPKIFEASSILAALRAITQPNLPWVRLFREGILGGLKPENRVIQDAITSPLVQIISHTLPALPGQMNNWWLAWRGVYDPYDLDRHTSIIEIATPQTRQEALYTHILYHPELSRGAGNGTRRWNSRGWSLLWNTQARTLDDVWDFEGNGPRIPIGFQDRDRRLMKKAIFGLHESLPRSWEDALATTDRNAKAPPPGTIPIRFKTNSDHLRRGTQLKESGFTSAYNALMKRRLEGVNFNNRVDSKLTAYETRVGTAISRATIWRGARNKYGNRKTGDLLWRLLHDKIITGERLSWLPPEQRLCHNDFQDLSLAHIWLDCSVSRAVWEEFDRIWFRITATHPFLPQSMDELLVFMAVGPYPNDKVKQRRWAVMYPAAVWSLWKTYLTHSFGQTEDYWNVHSAVAWYRNYLTRLIMVDRMACISSARGNNRQSPAVFKQLWNEEPRQIRLRKGPRCLQDADVTTRLVELTVDLGRVQAQS